MHDFSDLVRNGSDFTISALDVAQQNLIDQLQSNAATPLIKALQMVQLQRAIFVVGVFSIFDAILQKKLDSSNGFSKAEQLLCAAGEHALNKRFRDLQLAVNVLKHGRGRSYDELLLRASFVPFRVKLADQAFFYEGDVAEISTLIEVDNAFIKLCVEVIDEVSVALKTIIQNRL